MESSRKNCKVIVSPAINNTQQVKEAEASAKTGGPKRFRRLKWNELVNPGDLVVDERRGFEPWEGPSGFRADAFVKPIYRATKGDRARLRNRTE
jgi:hypothetical protein